MMRVSRSSLKPRACLMFQDPVEGRIQVSPPDIPLRVREPLDGI